MLKLLIVEGNVKELRDKAVEMGSVAQSDLYRNVLNSLADDLVCTIIYPTDEGGLLPKPDELADYNGIVWTGSALNIYQGGPAIACQIDFMKTCLGQRTNIFGSCWGLQVAAVAAGGKVAANAKGREIGIGRDIRINETGRSHPMYAGKPVKFDAVTVHLDHVVRLPEGATILAANEMSDVQAIEMKCGESLFWGVQYHPEFDLEYISGLIRRYGETLIDEGIRKDRADIEQWAGDLVAMHSEKDRDDLKQRYGLARDVLDPRCRLLELSNWLSYLRQVQNSG